VRLRNNAKLTLPYIERFTSLNLWMKASTGPVLRFFDASTDLDPALSSQLVNAMHRGIQ